MTTPQEVAGRYRLTRRIGAGGMSTVFLATDDVLERPVAVKLLAEHLAEDEAFVARFRREALAAARLQHPNIVQVFDSGADPDSDRHFIVMEFVDGPSCADVLREQRSLEVDDTVRILRDACHGLEYAHRAGVVHRDVKPGNLLLTADGILKLADFGIAKAAEQTRITQVGSVLGTAAYLSPEQAAGQEAGPPSDLYSLGVCGYQFLTGRLPHEYGSLTELALKQQNDPVEPITSFRDDVPASLDRAIRAALERDPNARYETALEMAEAVEAGYHGEDTDTTRALMTGGTEYATGGHDAATQALPRGNTMYEPPPARRFADTGVQAPAPTYAGRYGYDQARAPRKRRNWGRIVAALLALALIAAAIYLAVGLGSDADRIREPDIGSQVERLEQFIQDNTE